MNRQTKVFRSGSSLAVRIPKELAAALDLTEGVEITLHLRDSALVLHKEQNVMTTDYSEQPMFTVLASPSMRSVENTTSALRPTTAGSPNTVVWTSPRPAGFANSKRKTGGSSGW